MADLRTFHEISTKCTHRVPLRASQMQANHSAIQAYRTQIHC